MTARGADIEIFENAGTKDSGIIVPSGLRINGQEVLMPAGESVVVNRLSNDDAVTVTLTMFVNNLTIKREDTATKAFGGKVVHVTPDTAA